MSISNGTKANATNFNAAFVSRSLAQSVAGGKTFSNYIAETPADVATSATILALSSTTSNVRMTGSTATTVQGITAGVSGQVIRIYNASSAVVTLSNQNGTASAANRFSSFTGSDVSLAAGSSIFLRYDSTLSRWVQDTSAVGAAATGGGGINYITDSDGSSLGSWVTYADAAAVSPVDGTGGSPTSTFSVSTDSSLVGTTNFLWSKSAANRQGEGFSVNFSIDQAYQSKPLTISFLYKIDSGTYADDDMRVWIYDVTNATLIQPTGYSIKNAVGAQTQKCEFQAASNSTSYRLIVHTASTSSAAYTIRFDSFSVAQNTYSTGSSITDWTSFTPTGSWSSNTTYSGFYRRVSDSVEVQVYMAISGTPTAATLFVNLPPGLTINASKIPGAGQFRKVLDGSAGYVRDDSAGNNFPAEIIYNDTTSVYVALGSGTSGLGGTLNAITNTVPFTFANSDVISFSYSVPVIGWGSNQVLSSDTDTRVIAGRFSGNPASASSGNPIIFPTIDFDTTGSYNSTTGRYTSSVGGYYKIGGFLSAAQTSVRVSAYVDASLVCALGVTDSNGNGNLSGIVKVNAGQIIDVRPNGTLDEDANATLTIERISGPAQIAASEKIYLQYVSSSSNVLTANVTNATYLTKVTDSHGAWSGTSFTAPRANVYRFVGSFGMTGASSNYIQLYIDSTLALTGAIDSSNSIKPFAFEYYMLAGQVASFRSTAGVTLSTNSNNHWLSISSQ